MLWKYLKRNMLNNPKQVVFNDSNKITYYELINIAEKFGKCLVHHKYGILCKSDLNSAKAILACIAAGVTAVPLSNRYGTIHNQNIINSVRLNNIIQDINDELVVYKVEEQREEESCDAALILCTSGSTGSPKGVMLPEKAVMSNLKDTDKYYLTTNQDIIMASRGLYHCASIAGELFMSLIRGAGIYFYEGCFMPDTMAAKMEQYEITVYSGTPTVFYYLSKAIDKYKHKIKLRYCSVGGEIMSPVVLKNLLEMFPAVQFVHSYGLTETCSRATYLFLDGTKKANCVGQLLESLQACVVDGHGKEARSGCIGELLLKGNNITSGYYMDVQKTNTSFTGGWFNTGDLAWRDEDGLLYIEGRKDNLIIRGGVNIYPEEIENLLKKNEIIKDVMVYGENKNQVTERLIARVVPEQNKSRVEAGKAVMQICQEVLPANWIPDKIEIVEKIECNPTGKVIRRIEGVKV